MVRWFDKKYKLSSLELKPPGLIELLTKRATKTDMLFHWSMIGALITALVMELIYFISPPSTLGMSFLWAHGILGSFLVLGGLAYFVKYWRDNYFLLVTDRIFLVDTLFIAAIATSGMILSLKVLGILPTTALGLEGTLHILLTYTWFVVSLFFNGAVRHALATIVWRIYGTTKTMSNPSIFSDACGRCGKCVEACPLFEAYEREEEAPALKLRKYLKKLATEDLSVEEKKKIVEDVYVCTLCGLCVGVCPYSFNFVDLYKKLLAQVNELYAQIRVGKTKTASI